VPNLPRYIATRSRTRKYGYTVQDVNGLTKYFVGPNCTGGWYKYKRDAEQAAERMNNSIQARFCYVCE